MPHKDYVSLRNTILSNSIFQNDYDYYNNFLDFGIAIRKKSNFKDEIISFIKEEYKLKQLNPTKYKLH